jgi:asparagine synthase (glutamine-hydrolysing)
VSVIFNGELRLSGSADRARRERTSVPHTLRYGLIPHLWEDLGEGMLERLRGQFAIALWDERRRQLILARDRFGICPLYWTRQKTSQGEVLLFASEVKALLASGLVPARPDPRGINHVFTFFCLPGPVTCFAGVNCLLPGRIESSLQILGSSVAGQGSARVESIYWQIDFPRSR